MAHGHEHSVHGKDFVDVPPVHPAGASDSASHHGHTIVSGTTLLIVLAALVSLTLLTVGAALLEKFIVETFHVQPEIATTINVTICLLIAVVKTALVVLFFMQLKYDNPVNSMIFLFCLGTVACFLGFTMLDLGNRATIDTFKGVYVHPGGMGFATKVVQEVQKEDPKAGLASDKAITELAKDAAVINRTYDPAEAKHEHAAEESPYSSPQRSRPVKGMPDEQGAEPDQH